VQVLIEDPAIDDERFDTARRVGDLPSRRRPEPHSRQLVEHRAARQREFLECFRGEDARAVNRLADGRMFFEQQRPEPGSSQTRAGVSTIDALQQEHFTLYDASV